MTFAMDEGGGERVPHKRQQTRVRTDKLRIQGSTKRRALGCKKFLHGPAWVVLSKTSPPFRGARNDQDIGNYHK